MEIRGFVVSPIRSNCYVLSESLDKGAKAVIVDPGDRNLDEVLAYIDYHQFDVIANWNTHAHFDHVLGVDVIRDAFGCETYLHPVAAELWDGIPVAAMSWAQLETPQLRPIDRFYEDGDTVFLGDEMFTVWHTPGHSPDGVCLVGSTFALTGDTLFRATIGRTDLEESSPEAMDQSLERILAWDDQLALYPGHGASTMMEKERANNRFLRIAARKSGSDVSTSNC